MRLAQAGLAVTLGSRSLERARAVADELNQKLSRPLIGAAENREMLTRAEIVFLTVPFARAAEALKAYREFFRPGVILVDVTVPVKSKTSPGPDDLLEGSGSQHLAKLLPEGGVLVAAFKTIPAETLADAAAPLDCDEFVCSNSDDARARVLEILAKIPGLRPVDAGGLSAAGTLERMTALAIRLNRRYKIRSARFRVVGL